jgi:hypothetical protein
MARAALKHLRPEALERFRTPISALRRARSEHKNIRGFLLKELML